jgi:DNA (cytosine-5)-methyltransferase 1
MTAIISSKGSVVTSSDHFCGFGGSSQGILKAGADLRYAANHNPHAIKVHAANFPNADHRCADMVDPESADYTDPADLPGTTFAWFSPGCGHHTQANATKVYEQGRQALLFDDEEFDEVAFAKSERSRVTMSCVLRYLEKHKNVCQLAITENVVDVCFWGPGRDGTTFKWWLKQLRTIGYEYECCFLNSMFFPPCPQSRDRIYIVAWRKGNKRPDLDYRPTAFCTSQTCGGRIVGAVQTWKPRKASWPLPRWGKYERQYIYTCPDCRERVEPVAWPAYSAINWSNLGPTIGERSSLGLKELVPATIARIRRALARFSGGPPVVIPAKSVWGSERPVFMPFTTQTSQQEKALMSAVIPQRTHNQPVSTADQVPAVTTSGGGGHALCTAALVQQRYNGNPTSAHGQVPTVTTQQSDLTLASVIVPAAGNTYEKGNYVRAKHASEQLFTQHTTQAYGFASTPSLIQMRGGGSVESGQHPVSDAVNTVTAGGGHHGLMSMPFVMNGQDNDSAKSVDEPGFTVRAVGHHDLVSPALFAKFNGGPTDTAWHSTNKSLNTVTTSDSHGLVVLPWVDQFLKGADPIAITEQLATVMTHIRHALASVEELPLEAITEKDLMNVRFRMLEPDPELRYAMAFSPGFILFGTKSQITAGLGNAVTPPVAEWLTDRGLATLRGLSLN